MQCRMAASTHRHAIRDSARRSSLGVHTEEQSMRTTLVVFATLTAGFALPVGPAAAQSSPIHEWCMTVDEGGTSCNYDTLKQCHDSASGNGGFCDRNPSFAGGSCGHARRRSGNAPQGQSPRRIVLTTGVRIHSGRCDHDLVTSRGESFGSGPCAGAAPSTGWPFSAAPPSTSRSGWWRGRTLRTRAARPAGSPGPSSSRRSAAPPCRRC